MVMWVFWGVMMLWMIVRVTHIKSLFAEQFP